MASTNEHQETRRKVVVAPVVEGFHVSLVKVFTVWIISVAINAVLLLPFLWVIVGNAQGSTGEQTIIETTVEEPEKMADLTNTDLGLDSEKQLNFGVDRIEEVSVVGPVDPTAPAGILNAPDTSPRNVPPPPGAGGGTGLAMPSDDINGTGGMFGTLGGSGGLFNPGGFGGRSGSTRKKLLDEFGGNQASERAVAKGLEWFALHQAPDGHWSMHQYNQFARDKPLPHGKTFVCNCCDQPGGRMTATHDDIAATGFALLPFLGAGETHKPSGKEKQADYSKTVGGGLEYLMRKQNHEGFFGGSMYSHGIATIVMCEAYGLTSDPLLKASAQRGLNYLVGAQDPSGGGWRYQPRSPGDLSVTGWEVMALKSGQMAGLSVPAEVLKKAERFLDSCETSSKGYSYMPNEGERPPMTAVGMLCRQYMGINPRNPGLLAGVDRLKAVHPGVSNNIYYEYYATQVMHHMGGDAWKFWNEGIDKDGNQVHKGIRDTFLSRQDTGKDPKRAHQDGSWPTDRQWPAGGRMMSTSLSVLSLEVYYRHLPLYRRDMATTKEAK
jgi:hypothetical protein